MTLMMTERILFDLLYCLKAVSNDSSMSYIKQILSVHFL